MIRQYETKNIIRNKKIFKLKLVSQDFYLRFYFQTIPSRRQIRRYIWQKTFLIIWIVIYYSLYNVQ
jgi:hypothetical protein